MSGLRKALAAAVAAISLTLLACVYATALAAPAVGLFHDDGVYAVTAKALATGRGYRILSLPGEIAQTKYPILFPALLALVWKACPRFPENVFWLKLVPFTCALIWGALSYRLLRAKTDSARVAMTLTALMAISPWVLFLGTALLSETLFAALTTGTLLLLERGSLGRHSWKELAGAAVLAAAAFLTRTAGVAAIAAGVLVVWRRAGWRRAMVFLLLTAALCTPWIVWQNRQTQALSAADAYYARANYAQWDILFHFTLRQKITIVGGNLLGVWLSPAVLMGMPATGWGAALAVVAGGLVTAGFWRRLCCRAGATEILTSLFIVVILSWAWPPKRFVAPLLPLLLLYGYEGALAACRRTFRSCRATRVTLAAIALLFAIPGAWTLTASALAAGVTGAVPVPNTPEDDWREMGHLFAWIQQNTAADAVLMGNLDPTLYLYTGRKSVRGFEQDPYSLHYGALPGDWPLGSPTGMWRTLEPSHAGYLISTPNLSFREAAPLDRLTRELVRSHADRFRLVYQSGDTKYRIYRISSGDSAKHLRDSTNFAGIGSRLALYQTLTSAQTE